MAAPRPDTASSRSRSESPTMTSSGADRGFFQEAPVLSNQFYDDVAYSRCFKLFLPSEVIASTEAEVAALGRDVLSDQIFNWVTDAEHNKPYLRGSGRESFGKWKGELVTGEGWRQLQSYGLAKGIVATGYDTPHGPYSRPLQFFRLHLWEPSCANVTCPSAMQDGAATLLKKHLGTPALTSELSHGQHKVFADAFLRLTSRDPMYAWTSGQWMTERTGGSDVSLTETTAIYQPREDLPYASQEDQLPQGPWSINGFKWFSSATDSNMTVLLAQTGVGGLSAFLAPMRVHDPAATTSTGLPDPNGQRLNGVRIQRLKNKFGTQSLPTAELVLEDMRGWMIGKEGKGIHEISAVLTLTRVHSAVAAVAYLGRGLGIARAYARVREIGAGKGARMRLIDSALHMRTLAKMTSEYRGLMLLTYFTSYVLGLSEHPDTAEANTPAALVALTPQTEFLEPLLRVLSQLTKAYVCKSSVPLLFSCMESLGGVGYLLNEEQEYLNIARLYRDICVLPIWEGTTDVLSTDFIRALKHPKAGKDSLDALNDFITRASAFPGKSPRPDSWDPVSRWKALQGRITSQSQVELMGEARELLWEVADILVSVLLFVDAGSDGDAAAEDVFARFVSAKFPGEKRPRQSAKEELGKDLAIVYGLVGVDATPKL